MISKSSPIYCSKTSVVATIDIDLVVDSLLNHGKVAFLSSLKPLSNINHLGNRLIRLLLFLFFSRVSNDYVLDRLGLGYVNGLLTVIIGYVNICPIAQQ